MVLERCSGHTGTWHSARVLLGLGSPTSRGGPGRVRRRVGRVRTGTPRSAAFPVRVRVRPRPRPDPTPARQDWRRSRRREAQAPSPAVDRARMPTSPWLRGSQLVSLAVVSLVTAVCVRERACVRASDRSTNSRRRRRTRTRTRTRFPDLARLGERSVQARRARGRNGATRRVQERQLCASVSDVAGNQTLASPNKNSFAGSRAAPLPRLNAQVHALYSRGKAGAGHSAGNQLPSLTELGASSDRSMIVLLGRPRRPTCRCCRCCCVFSVFARPNSFATATGWLIVHGQTTCACCAGAVHVCTLRRGRRQKNRSCPRR